MAQIEPRENDRTGLAAGTRLGHYVVQKKLGGGGMGDVYEAVDEKLQRSVAIKILPAELSADDQSRRRFQWEAQAASALNHPNIVTVYEVGREGAIDFLAMEQVHGRTLRQVIGARGMDLRAAISYATQIADALAAAHRAGIVHRDLKPDNVMLNERDLVKVLDFGLAKKIVAPSRPAPDDPTATLAPSLTDAGLAVGTVSYMSPEQVEAKDVDARSDIFSFGCVLYEMLTGGRAFQGENKFGIAAAVLSKEPQALRDLVPAAPRTLERIVEKCLRKKLLDRWQDMGDVKLLLQDVSRELDDPPPAPTPAQRRRLWPAVLVAALAGAAVGTVAWRAMLLPAPENPAQPILRQVTADSGLNDFPALSRDGKLIAFASDRNKEGNLDIWLQQIGGREPIRLTSDPADESDPGFSPDGTRIAFRSEKGGGGIYVVPTLGGDPVLLAPGGRNPRFSPDGRWVAYWTGGEGVTGSAAFLIDAGGGQPQPVHPEMDSATNPVWSPRGDELIVFGRKGKGSLEATLDWWILPLGKGDPKKTGVLPQLKAQKLTEIRLATQVRPTPLDWRDDGTNRVLFAAALGDAVNLWEISLSSNGLVSGWARSATLGPGQHMHAAWAKASDMARLAFADEELNFDVWTVAVDADRGAVRGEMKRITEGGATEWAPSITWDGSKIAFLVRRSGIWTLRTADPEGRAERTLLSSPIRLVNAKLAGDGSRIVYSTIENNLFSIPGAGGAVEKLCERCGTVMGVSFNGARATYEPMELEDLTMFDAVEHTKVKLASRQRPDAILSAGQFSRDGRWVAFHSTHNATRTDRVWIAAVDQNRPAPPEEWIAVTEGKSLERNPYWAPGGALLYFTSEQDGFRCIWARRLDPSTKKPAGDAFPVQHFHTARRSLRRIGNAGYLTGLSVGGDVMVFALGELTGNIWMEERVGAK